MNVSQIAFLKSLDKDASYGTIQTILLNPDLQIIPFESAVKFLLTAMMDERKSMQEVADRMRKELVKHNLYTNAVAIGGVYD